MNQTMLMTTALTGALIWGIVNVLKKSLLDKYKIHEDVMTVGLMLGIAITAFTMQFTVHGMPVIKSGFWWPLIASVIINFFIQYFNVKALKLEDASIVVPLSATQPAIVIVASYLILGEFPTFFGRIGILLIACGAYILSLKGTAVVLPKWLANMIPAVWHPTLVYYGAPWFRITSSRGAQLALGSAYLGAIAINFDKMYVLAAGPMFAAGSAYFSISCGIFLWSLLWTKRWAMLDKTHFMKTIYLGMFFGIGAVLVDVALIYGIVPYVGALRRTQILWTIVLAGIFLKEKHFLPRIVGATIIFIGTILVAF